MRFDRIIALIGVVALALGSLAMMPALSGQAQMGPMTGPPLEQLSGDDFDKAFLRQMSMHHHMAVMMAQPLAANASHQELKDLGNTIIRDQTREIVQMREWLKAWYGMDMPMHDGAMGPGMMPGGQPGQGPMPGHGPNHMPGMGPGGMGPGGQMPGTGTGGMSPGGQMPGMGHGMGMMGGMFASLSGPRLEISFLSLMIPHHQDAVTMARLAQDRAAHQEVKDLAQNIMTSQSAEIAMMNAWLATWYGL